jgi:clan AA aspartic protease
MGVGSGGWVFLVFFVFYSIFKNTGELFMGLVQEGNLRLSGSVGVHAEITLRNAGDVTNVRRGYIKEPEIRQTNITAVVDTGAATLVINEDLRRQLGLVVESAYEAELADGSAQTYNLTESVQIQWKDRKTSCHAVVVPNANNVLLGAIPLEAMDLIVHPSKQELVGAHGDEIVYMIL